LRIYKANEVDDQRFYKIPKSLFGNEFYKGMAIESKVVYSFLRDRMELSKINGWINDNGEVYLIFSREKIAELIETSLPTVTKAFKQLTKYNLIVEKRQGLGRPNLIFVCHIELSQVNQQKQNILLSGYKENLHQDTKNFCANDTEFIKTNKNNTEIYNASSSRNDGVYPVDNFTDTGKAIYDYFIEKYYISKGEKHPPINQNIIHSINKIMEDEYITDPEHDTELEINIEAMVDMIDWYFDSNNPLYGDRRIYHFLSPMILKNLYYKAVY